MKGVFVPKMNKPDCCMCEYDRFGTKYHEDCVFVTDNDDETAYICRLTGGRVGSTIKPEIPCPLREIKDTDCIPANTVRQMCGCKPVCTNYVSVGGILNVLPNTMVKIFEVQEDGPDGWNKQGMSAQIIVTHVGSARRLASRLSTDILQKPVVRLDSATDENGDDAYHIVIFADSEDEEAEKCQTCRNIE